MSSVNISDYNKCFEYESKGEVVITSVDNSPNDNKVFYDSDDQLFWVKDDIQEFRFTDNKSKKIAIHERSIFLMNSEESDSDKEEWVVFSSAENKLRKSIMKKLGYPVVDLELTLGQIKDCMEDTVKEMAPWVVQLNYATVDFTPKIDMSEYNVDYVINVVAADYTAPDQATYQNGGVVDIFATCNYREVSGYRETLYRNLELNQLNKITSQVSGGIHWTFLDQTEELLVDVGNTNARRVTITYSPKIRSIDDLKDEIYITLAEKFTLAFAREILSNIRGKFSVDGSPVTLDADSQHDRSSSELDRLREEMKNTVSTHFMID